MHTRRTFILRGAMGAGALAIATGPRVALGAGGSGCGPLVPDPGGLLDLPDGFRYGDTYVFAENRLVGAEEGDATELAGPTFAPDGKTFFVNLYDPGHTLAITGPFRSRRDDGTRWRPRRRGTRTRPA